jgi:hypothetical protein
MFAYPTFAIELVRSRHGQPEATMVNVALGHPCPIATKSTTDYRVNTP